MLAREKHSSLLQKSVITDNKRFITLIPARMEEWRHNTQPVDVKLNDKQHNLHDTQHDDIKRINK